MDETMMERPRTPWALKELVFRVKPSLCSGGHESTRVEISNWTKKFSSAFIRTAGWRFAVTMISSYEEFNAIYNVRVHDLKLLFRNPITLQRANFKHAVRPDHLSSHLCHPASMPITAAENARTCSRVFQNHECEFRISARAQANARFCDLPQSL